MRLVRLIALLALVLISRAPARAHADVADTYCNPIDVVAADPFVMRVGDTYYLYATGSRDGCPVWSSRDLVNWRHHGLAYRKSPDGWAQLSYWAPEAFAHHGKFYLIFSARGDLGAPPVADNPATQPTEAAESSRDAATQPAPAAATTGPAARRPPPGKRRMILAESDSPLGPFREVKAPWFDDVPGSILDGHVFKDTDGRLYLYYVTDGTRSAAGETHVRRLRDDLTVDGESVFCIRPSQSWEGNRWNEGPFVMRRGDTYFLMYSANGWYTPRYSVGYATATSPLGPWTKHPEPILTRTADVVGPGHHAVVPSPDGSELFIVYHTHQLAQPPRGWGSPRHVAIDRLRFVDEDGQTRIEVDGPTTTPQPMPSGAAPLVRGQSDEFDAAELDRARWTIFGEDASHWSLKDGRLVIRTQSGDVHARRSDARNLLLQHAPDGDFTVTTRVAAEPTRDLEQAFLMIWQDHHHYLKLATIHRDGPKLELAREQSGTYTPATSTENGVGRDLHLRITKRGDTYTSEVSRDGTTWEPVGEPLELKLNDLRIGIGAVSPLSHKQIDAAFDFVRFESAGAPPR